MAYKGTYTTAVRAVSVLAAKLVRAAVLVRRGIHVGVDVGEALW